MLFWVLLSCCYQPPLQVWTDVCVNPGIHPFLPAVANKNDDLVAYGWQFTPASRYNLPYPDIRDYNKLTGAASVRFLQWDARKNSLLVGWRYDPGTDLFELTPYLHVNREPYNVETEPPPGVDDWGDWPVYVGVNEEFETFLNWETSGALSLTLITDEHTHFFTYPFNADHIREVNAWFGGNQKAPIPICLERKLIE